MRKQTRLEKLVRGENMLKINIRIHLTRLSQLSLEPNEIDIPQREKKWYRPDISSKSIFEIDIIACK